MESERPDPTEEATTPPMRYRVAAVIVALAVFVGVVGLAWLAIGRGNRPPGAGSADVPPAEEASPVSIWLSASEVPPGPAELVAMLVNHGSADVTFGVAATLERWNGGAWVPRGRLVMCLDHWHCTARVDDAAEPLAVPSIGLSPRPGTPGPIERFTTDGLDVGWYRLAQEANEGVVAAGIFEITEGAQPLPPLVPIDAPAISVSPALLSPDGGAVSLYPLIPTPSGSQSREDIQRAINGLSETAQLERWDGSAWETVAEIELTIEGGDDLARSARLPGLRPGAYRLVREGPDATHVGNLWVVG